MKQSLLYQLKIYFLKRTNQKENHDGLIQLKENQKVLLLNSKFLLNISLEVQDVIFDPYKALTGPTILPITGPEVVGSINERPTK